MNETPLVSILTPSFNQARWLGDNLATVSAQTYPKIEHVVMDGGSTDGSVELLQAAGETVVWRSEPDAGQSDALSKALEASSGEIIGWINSDDGYFITTAVERAVAYFSAHPEVDLVYGHSAYVDARGRVLNLMWVPEYTRWWLMRQNYISQPTVFMRRSALEGQAFDQSFHFSMDYELWLRLLSQGRKLARIDSVLAFERVQSERKSITLLDVRDENDRRLVQTYGIVVGGRLNSMLVFALGVMARFVGLRLIGQASRDLAYDAPHSSTGALVRRQIAQRHSRMDVGE